MSKQSRDQNIAAQHLKLLINRAQHVTSALAGANITVLHQHMSRAELQRHSASLEAFAEQLQQLAANLRAAQQQRKGD